MLSSDGMRYVENRCVFFCALHSLSAWRSRKSPMLRLLMTRRVTIRSVRIGFHCAEDFKRILCGAESSFAETGSVMNGCVKSIWVQYR